MQKELILTNPLVWLLLSVLYDFVSAIFMFVTLGEKIKFKKAVIFAVLSATISFILRMQFSAMFILIISTLSWILLAIFVLRFRILEAFISVFLVTLAGAPGEMFAAFLCTNIMGITSLQINTQFYYHVIYFLISLSTFILIVLIIYYSRIKINILEDINRKRNVSLVINGFITLALTAPNILYFTTSKTDIPSYLITYNLIAIFGLFGLSIYNTLRGAQLNSKSQQLEIQMLYNKTLTDLVDSLRGFRHDFSNTLHSISGFIALNDMQGLKEYFNNLKSDYSSVSSLSLANSTIIKNPPIYGLIVSKFYIAESKGINVNLDIATDTLNSKMRIYDLTKILGIFMDNAIEAAEKTEDKIINLKMREDGSVYTIEISNSYSGEINIQEIFKKGFSSKGADRGLGLWEVKIITDKSKSVSLKTQVKDNMFSQILCIEQNKKVGTSFK